VGGVACAAAAAADDLFEEFADQAVVLLLLWLLVLLGVGAGGVGPWGARGSATCRTGCTCV
jgi:hypothetical protein